MAETAVRGATPHIHVHSGMKMSAMEGDSKMSSGMMMEMAMPQWFTTKTGMHFLLENLKFDSITGIIVVMLFTILLALVFETLNFVFNSKRKAFSERTENHVFKDVTSHILLSGLKVASVFAGYLLMLCAMTFNIWLLVSVVVGSGVAHLLLRPLLSLCISSGQSDWTVTGEEDATKDLLHDFPRQNETCTCSTFIFKENGDVTQDIPLKETRPLVTDEN